MRVIPIDAARLTCVVVGEPTAQVRDGQPVLDRDSGKPLWQVDVTVIVDGRAETVQLQLPEGAFPKEMGIGTLLTPEMPTAITWEKNGRSGVMVRAKSVKVVGGQAGLRAVANS